MKKIPDFTRALADIDQLNEICSAFRQAYLRLNPTAKPNQAERIYSDAVAYVRLHSGVDLTPR